MRTGLRGVVPPGEGKAQQGAASLGFYGCVTHSHPEGGGERYGAVTPSYFLIVSLSSKSNSTCTSAGEMHETLFISL